MEAIPVCLAVSPNPQQQQYLADRCLHHFYTAHGEVDPAYSLSDLDALSSPIHLFDLSCGADQLQGGIDAVPLIAVPITTLSSMKAAAKIHLQLLLTPM
jgi:hypothetical protein